MASSSSSLSPSSASAAAVASATSGPAMRDSHTDNHQHYYHSSQDTGKRDAPLPDLIVPSVIETPSAKKVGISGGSCRTEDLSCLSEPHSKLNPAVLLSTAEQRTDRDQPVLSAILVGGHNSSRSGIKKRLSWKHERSLETVCYLESVGSTSGNISAPEDCNQHEPESPVAPLWITTHSERRSANQRSEKTIRDHNELSRNQDSNSAQVVNKALSISSNWVLSSEELKSKLESVYAAQQQHDDGDVWKVNVVTPGSKPANLEADVISQETTMRDAVAVTVDIGKSFSLKQQLSGDATNQFGDSVDHHSRDIHSNQSGNHSPESCGTPSNSSRPKLNRLRSTSGSGSESLKDCRRKLDDVSHKTQQRIERDREVKCFSSNGHDDRPMPTFSQSKQRLRLPLPTETLQNGNRTDSHGTVDNVAVEGSMKAYRRRKKSMAIALSEGRLELHPEPEMSPTDNASELNLASQLSQLNHEFMQLSETPPSTPSVPSYVGSLPRSVGPSGSLMSLQGLNSRTWKSSAQLLFMSDDPLSKKAGRRSSLKEDEGKDSKMTSPKVLLSRIKQWSKKKPKPKPRPEIVRIDLAESKPDTETDTTSGRPAPLMPLPADQTGGGDVVLRHVPLNKDTALRKTWHGMTSESSVQEGRDYSVTLPSNFQRCNSLRNPIRQRKRGVSPMENAHLVAMHMSTETLPGSSVTLQGSSVDSGIVNDRFREETTLPCDSDTSSSNLCSPCSSLGSSNPPSRPLSSDLGDLQWEKASTSDQRSTSPNNDERRLSAVTIGRRESASGGKSRRMFASRLSLSPPGTFSCEDPEGAISPKRVTFSEDLTKKAVEEDLKKLPKPRHLPRRIKPDVGEVTQELPAQPPRPYLMRGRAHSDQPSLKKRDTVSVDAKNPGKSSLPRRCSIPNHMELLEGQDTGPAPRKNSLADLIGTEVGDVLTSFAIQYDFEPYSPDTMPTFAEALWDHVTMDETELAFTIGNVIEVTDMRDKNWWWGCKGEVEGWVPAQFLRLRVSQGETVEECVERLREERDQQTTNSKQPSTKKNRKVSLNFLSNNQVRSKVVEEIIDTERDYVRHLHDVCEGYMTQALDRPEMFSPQVTDIIFGNIEEIYSFQKGFLLQLEASIDHERPDLSRIGGCFLEHKHGFETYSEYCNNYPRAIKELKQLEEKQKYRQFFEACRLLQNMIEISLDGFLLTPIQKICKYPLQLRELLKYTRPQHPDWPELQQALEDMKDVAVSINDRKRRLENIDKIAAWQRTISEWEGDDILEESTQLIHSGELAILAGRRWATGRRVFLFDHQLVVCKKDWRGTLLYKKRIQLDSCREEDMLDGRDTQFNISSKHAIRIVDCQQNKCDIFACKDEDEKQEWMKMFERQRELVNQDIEKGFSIPTSTREAAMKNVMAGDQQPNKPSDSAVVTRKVSTMPYAYQHKILPTPNKKVPLPRAISSTDLFKKKPKGLFGMVKK